MEFLQCGGLLVVSAAESSTLEATGVSTSSSIDMVAASVTLVATLVALVAALEALVAALVNLVAASVDLVAASVTLVAALIALVAASLSASRVELLDLITGAHIVSDLLL